MSTVRGTVLSSKPISISKAASTMASFVSSDTGAPKMIGVYLRRALASFKELKQLQKELKSPRSRRRRNRDRSEAGDDDVATTAGENPTRSFVLSEEVSRGVELEVEDRNFGEVGGEIAERADSVEVNNNNKKKKKRKERGSVGNSDENFGQIEKGDKIAEGGQVTVKREAADSVEIDSKKKKKNRDNVGNSGENGVKIEQEEVGGVKKRKGGVLDDGGSDALEEERDKKKKRKS